MSTVSDGQLSNEELKAAETIQKLLNLAARAGTPAEGEAALAKAQALMLKHNLDQATVEGSSGLDGKREKGLVEGGFYAYKRELWAAVAEVHFCMYWSQKFRTEQKVKQTHRIAGEYVGMREVHAMRRRHALIGRVVNVRMTKGIAEYLEGAIERELREAIAGKNASGVYEENAKSNWAHSWRKGCARRLCQKLSDRHYDNIRREEQERKRAAERAGSGASTSKALTVAAFSEAEEEGNMDFLYGEGWSAEQRAKRVKRAAERERELAEWAAWCAANPEEAAKLAEEERKREEKNASRRTGRRSYGSSRGDNTDMSAYYSGQDAAEKIGLDPQAKDTSSRRDQKKITGSKDIHL